MFLNHVNRLIIRLLYNPFFYLTTLAAKAFPPPSLTIINCLRQWDVMAGNSIQTQVLAIWTKLTDGPSLHLITLICNMGISTGKYNPRQSSQWRICTKRNTGYFYPGYRQSPLLYLFFTIKRVIALSHPPWTWKCCHLQPLPFLMLCIPFVCANVIKN